jgi:hypothetical protein
MQCPPNLDFGFTNAAAVVALQLSNDRLQMLNNLRRRHLAALQLHELESVTVVALKIRQLLTIRFSFIDLHDSPDESRWTFVALARQLRRLARRDCNQYVAYFLDIQLIIVDCDLKVEPLKIQPKGRKQVFLNHLKTSSSSL